MDTDRGGAGDAFRVTADQITDDGDGIGLLGIDHVGIAVTDLDAAIDFYRQVLGVPCRHRETNQEQGVREAMLAPAPAGGPMVQLLAPIRADSPVARFLDRSGPGMHHVAYAVVDVESGAAALRGRGIRLLYDTPRRGTAGSRINFTHPQDTGGVLVELVERATPAGG